MPCYRSAITVCTVEIVIGYVRACQPNHRGVRSLRTGVYRERALTYCLLRRYSATITAYRLFKRTYLYCVCSCSAGGFRNLYTRLVYFPRLVDPIRRNRRRVDKRFECQRKRFGLKFIRPTKRFAECLHNTERRIDTHCFHQIPSILRGCNRINLERDVIRFCIRYGRNRCKRVHPR